MTNQVVASELSTRDRAVVLKSRRYLRFPTKSTRQLLWKLDEFLSPKFSTDTRQLMIVLRGVF